MKKCITAGLLALAMLVSCKQNYKMGTYGFDKQFLASHGIETVELCSPDGLARALVVPAWQGRVATSTTGGEKGHSYGWFNKRFIEEGKIVEQINPYGGEERFWIGPEGGPFSWYFAKGVEQVYKNWFVPSVIDTEAFDLESSSAGSAVFSKRFSLKNASDVNFDMSVRRVVTLLSREEIETLLGIQLPEAVRIIGYRTDNNIENVGPFAWNTATGMPSVWLLGCFNPTPTTTVFIPYEKSFAGKPVNDMYFGKVPSDRLILEDGTAYFKIDGEYRSKIGLPKGSAKDVCGSYDSATHTLNILKYTVPEGDAVYVNGQWGPQEDPFCGDVINSYNDGINDSGDIMGPFYEIETSSPAAALQPGQSLTHSQTTIHMEGDESLLSAVAEQIFGVSLEKVSGMFRK